MSIYFVIGSIFLLIGPTATHSMAMCTAQGFILYVCFETAIYYYALFSIYSYVGVISNFELDKIRWIEKWVHGLAHLYPFGTGIYLLTIQGYNPNNEGFCYVGSAPFGCVFDADTYCERGPQDATHGNIITYISISVLLLFPTSVMIALNWTVKKKQTTLRIQAKAVAQQSFIYVVALYWELIPWCILYVLDVLVMRGTVPLTVATGFQAYATLNYYLFCFYIMIVYIKFSVKKKNSTTTIPSIPSPPNIFASNEFDPNTTTAMTSTTSDIIRSKQTSTAPTTTTNASSSRSYEFNIFDGTNPSAGYAEFIFDGDSDDEAADNAETDQWDAVQDHV